MFEIPFDFGFERWTEFNRSGGRTFQAEEKIQ